MVGSKLVRVKEGMLLYAANPRETLPSKAVRQLDFEYLFGVLEKLVCHKILEGRKFKLYCLPKSLSNTKDGQCESKNELMLAKSA